MTDGRIFFDHQLKNGFIAYDNVRQIATDQGDDYTTTCLTDYNCFKEHYRKIVIG